MQSVVWKLSFTPLCALASLSLVVLNAPLVNASSTAHRVNVSVGGKRILTANSILAPDPMTGKTTSWLPAQDVETVARALGLSAYWVDGVDELQMMLPVGSTDPIKHTLTYHKPSAGEFVTLVDSKAVQYAPLRQANGSAGQSYLPVYYVMRTFQQLDVHSNWNGSSWTLSGHVANPSAPPAPGALNSTFQLTLANADPENVGLPAPPVPDAAPVTVTLPFNPSSQPSTLSFPDANQSVPLQDYMQTGKAEYIIQEPVANVESWFEQAYQLDGFHQTGSGQTGNVKTGEYSESLFFAPTDQQPNRSLNVAMSFQSEKTGQTLVEYWVADSVVPPRPADTYIPNGVTEVDVAFADSPGEATGGADGVNTAQGSASPQSSPEPITKVTNPSAIKQLTDTVNGLTEIDPPGISSGGSALSTDWQQATLVFITNTGQKFTVVTAKNGTLYAPVQIDGIPFVNGDGAVWNAIEQATGHTTS
ncbi:hypothetical protein NZD89_00985 [Alicyclobacillus fastidiosus]|uniref:Copper amine oxidase-like N-terminal domain-containing protein n=1 Tax=Alicyclobacillus fastidiosus TaxID=392011 RepID=A0ABY6ZIU5_9BACL|nr:hypothetical protein [Alicyclobacillus fastidiosus]WAH42126.1 hypothetical protein NZD89_00985 [Alicyclobacillus fastidiosus]GMA63906.1 hypothetical protein GCM10025859_43460 [Alicyclobacillus fastidiosus]